MKNSIVKRILSTAVASFLAISSTPFVAKELDSNAAKMLQTSPSHTQETGWYNDYHHEIWQADTPNSSTMTLYDNGGGFSTSWKCGPNNSRGNFLARRGLYYGLNNPKHWQDYGGFTCDFDCSWSAGSSAHRATLVFVFMAGHRILSLSSTSSRTGKTGVLLQTMQSRLLSTEAFTMYSLTP